MKRALQNLQQLNNNFPLPKDAQRKLSGTENRVGSVRENRKNIRGKKFEKGQVQFYLERNVVSLVLRSFLAKDPVFSTERPCAFPLSKDVLGFSSHAASVVKSFRDFTLHFSKFSLNMRCYWLSFELFRSIFS